jgi:hypothetical protein
MTHSVRIGYRYIRYTEGGNSLELDVDPSPVGPAVIYVPTSTTWARDASAWAAGRREDILGVIRLACGHLKWEWDENAAASLIVR